MAPHENGGSLTNPKTWSQIVAAMPVTIGILVILGLQLYLNDQNNRENRMIERDELKAQKEFNGKLANLFQTIATATKRNADAMEALAKDSREELAESKRYTDAIVLRNELLREQNELLRAKK